MTITEQPMREWLAIDRCDACGAQAMLAAQKGGGTELLMCGHHANKYRDALLDQGFNLEENYEHYLD